MQLTKMDIWKKPNIKTRQDQMPYKNWIGLNSTKKSNLKRSEFSNPYKEHYGNIPNRYGTF